MQTQKPTRASEVFQAIRQHMLTQNKKSADEIGGCSFYHGPKGLKCPVGLFINPEDYDPRIEGIPVSDQEVLDILNIETSSKIVAILIQSQHIHDSVPTEEWGGALKEMGAKFFNNKKKGKRDGPKQTRKKRKFN